MIRLNEHVFFGKRKRNKLFDVTRGGNRILQIQMRLGSQEPKSVKEDQETGIHLR